MVWRWQHSRSQIQTVSIPLTTHQGYPIYVCSCDTRYHEDGSTDAAKHIFTPHSDNHILREQQLYTKGRAYQGRHVLGLQAGIDSDTFIKETRSAGVCVICCPCYPSTTCSGDRKQHFSGENKTEGHLTCLHLVRKSGETHPGASQPIR